MVDGQEKEEALLKKLQEEVEEIDLASNDAELAEQFGDVSEAYQALAIMTNVTWHDIEVAKLEKAKKVGGFTGGYLVETVGVPDDSPWLQHFLDNPDKYPEVEQ